MRHHIKSIVLITALILGSRISVFAFGEHKVTVTDNGNTVVLQNASVAITINKSNAEIRSILYNSFNLLSGGTRGGSVYWSWNMPNYQNPSNCSYNLTVDPSTNNGEYAEVKLSMRWDGSDKQAAMDVDIYYSLSTETQGFYASAMLTHPASYPLYHGGEWRMVIYPSPSFDWMTVDSLRNKQMSAPQYMAQALPVKGAPKEVSLFTSGIYKNLYECKYDYSADFGDINVWGWSSTQKHIGLWMTAPSKEYYNGGPMKRELMCHASTTLLNMLGGTHYRMGGDMEVVPNESWQKVYGPFLVYCNKTSPNTSDASSVLWKDALAKAKAEQAKWPYDWYSNPSYAKAKDRGAVKGKLVIKDATIAHPISAANVWVGVATTPVSSKGVTDFQFWSKSYQFWVRTDKDGNFSIPNVIAANGYNIYAFGDKAAGTFSKLNAINVTAQHTTDLGNVVWEPSRVAPTVWEIGIPDRNAMEFKHGKDWFTSNTYPDEDWGKFMDYQREFPNDVNYTVGKSIDSIDWNFVQPATNSNNPQWKVNFNLAKAPTDNSQASVYVAYAAIWNGNLTVDVNGHSVNITDPEKYKVYPSNAMIRKGIHGAWGELRYTFPASYLQKGTNKITFGLNMRGGVRDADIMYDYLRLEAAGTSVIKGD